VTLSFGLFCLRGIWMIAAPQRLDRWWVKVVPHVIDTVLLASAIAMAVMSKQYPLEQSWLTAKVLALLAYIVLGMVALRRGRTRRQRVVAWLLAVVVFGYIVAVAHTRTPAPWG
jgi:uncharacterized membrane protein SirB2